MKNILVATLLLIFSIPVFSQTCQFSETGNLSKETIKQLQIDCEQTLLEAQKTPQNIVGASITDPQKMSQWGMVAQEWAKALGIAANEMGIAVDQFLKTDAGKLTAAIIIWQVAGENLIGLIVGIPLLIVVLFVGIRTAKRAKIKRISYGEPKGWFNTREVIEIEYYREDETVMYWVAYIVTIILSMIIVAALVV